MHQNAPGNGYASVVIRGRTSAAQLIFSLQLHPQSFRVSVVVPGRALISKRRWWLVERNVPLLVNKYSTKLSKIPSSRRVLVSRKLDRTIILFYSHRWNLTGRLEKLLGFVPQENWYSYIFFVNERSESTKGANNDREIKLAKLEKWRKRKGRKEIFRFG